MAKIINMAEFQKRMRNELAAEILHHDQHPVQDTEADRLYATSEQAHGRNANG